MTSTDRMRFPWSTVSTGNEAVLASTAARCTTTTRVDKMLYLEEQAFYAWQRSQTVCSRTFEEEAVRSTHFASQMQTHERKPASPKLKDVPTPTSILSDRSRETSKGKAPRQPPDVNCRVHVGVQKRLR
jgi:hypothetical protein